MTNLLINEPPLQILPTLAARVGLKESIVLQQFHYWLQKSKHEYDGKRWIYNNYPEWQKQFPFWSTTTIKRIILNLENQGLIISANYNKAKMDRTKWYTINYAKLQQLEPTNGPDWSNQCIKLTPPIPEITTENTNNNIYSIFEHWNSKGIICHRELKQKLQSTINARLKYYTAEQIKEAINNYATVLQSEEYYWTYRWTLKEFLERGLDKFLTENNPLENYRSKGGKNCSTELESPQPEEDWQIRLVKERMRIQQCEAETKNTPS